MDTFSIGGVFAQGRRIFGLHPLGFLIFAIAFAGIPTLFTLLWGTPLLARLQASARAAQDGAAATYAAIFAVSAAPGIVTFLGNIVLAGAVATAAWRDAEGRPAGFGDSLRAGVGLFLPLLLVTILSGLGIMLGMMLLVVPGLMLVFMWFVVIQVYAVERAGIAAAFRRSRSLTSGYRWRLVGLSLLYALVAGGASGVVPGALAVIARQGDRGTAALLVLQVLAAAIKGFFAVVSAAGLAAVYLELRRAKEGYLSRDLVDAFA